MLTPNKAGKRQWHDGGIVGHVTMLALAAAALAPTQAAAQRVDSVRVRVARAVTPFEVQVERLALKLVQQQQLALSLAGTREELRFTLRSVDLPDGERGVVSTRLRRLDAQLASMEGAGAAMRRQLEELCAPSQQTEGWLGVTFQSNYNMDIGRNGVQLTHFRDYPAVESVERNSPAEKGGVRKGDILLSLGGRELQDAAVVFQELLKPGARLPLRVRRGLESKTLSLVVEPRPADFQPTCAWEDDLIAAALAPRSGGMHMQLLRTPLGSNTGRVGGFNFETSSGESPRIVFAAPNATSGVFFFSEGPSRDRWAAGAQLAPLSPGLSKLTGAEHGVFVEDVARRSPAARAGLRSGDVIVSADGRPVHSPATLNEFLERGETRELTLLVVRDRKNETVVLRW